MNRRSFFRHFGGLVAAVAVAQGVVKKLVTDTVTEVATKEFLFRPEDYVGAWKVMMNGSWEPGVVYVLQKDGSWEKVDFNTYS